ncbi:AsmA family protein [Sphingomonas sp.]|uniref:AsmA family protein n=1 Tax=Sphingomonas sp. TaxID=28214 RepID=UPI003B003B0C
MATTADSARASDASPPPPRGRRPARWHAPLGIGLGILGCLLGLIVLAWAVLFITKGRFLKHTVENVASKSSGRRVAVAGDFQLYLDPINVKFVADGITVSNPAWASKPNFFQADHVDTRISTVRAIFGHYHARWLNLIGAGIDAEWDKEHKHNTWTFGAPSKPGKPFEMPTVDQAMVAGTTVRYRDPSMRLATDIAFDTVRSTGKRIDNAIRAHGTGTVRGEPFKMEAALLSPNSAIAMGRTQVTAAIDAVSSHADITGTLQGPTKIEGAQLDIGLRGPNIATIGTLGGLVIPATRAYRIRSHFTMADGKYQFTRLNGRVGDSDLSGRMTVSLPNKRPTIDADLHSDKLDIIDVGPLIGYDPKTVAKGATAAATTQGTPSGGHPRILPDAPLRAEALKTMDAHVRYSVRVIRAPNVPVSNVALTLDLDHNLLKLSPLTMDVAGGHLAADISLNARVPAVVTDYDIRMSPTPMGRLLKGFGMADPGTTGTIKARIKMRGTGDSVRKSLATSNGRIAIGLPAGTFITSYAQLSEFDVGVFLQKLLQGKLKQPIQINCGLIAFTVKNGVATTDPVLIDTDKNVMTATGGFSFVDESLNLTFRSRAKKFSAFSGQAPAYIKGYFGAPGFSVVSPQLIGRAAAAVALGVVASPIASVLAFVDVGATADTACGPVLAGATTAAQHTEGGNPVKGINDKGANREQAAKPRKKFLGIF